MQVQASETRSRGTPPKEEMRRATRTSTGCRVRRGESQMEVRLLPVTKGHWKMTTMRLHPLSHRAKMPPGSARTPHVQSAARCSLRILTR